MKSTKKIFLLFITLFAYQYATAQGLKMCGTDEAEREFFNQHPDLYKKYLLREEAKKLVDETEAQRGYASQRTAAQQIYIIPVVFHVLHQFGTENISDAQIYDVIRVINEDYSKSNSDYANTVAQFQSIAGNVGIEFRLAQLDPNGNCTNGIDRIYSHLTNNGGDNAKLNPWPADEYLNIWTVKKFSGSHAGAAAYAYLPGNAPQGADGIISLSSYIGSIGTSSANFSHTISHEIGHWIDLLHPWGTGNQPGTFCGDDFVSDTPQTQGSPLVCNLNLSVCNSPAIENVQNFMDYSYCTTMFTSGQKLRMRNALIDPLVGRDNLWSTTNLSITGVDAQATLCAANFITDQATNNICENQVIKFSDISYNGFATSRVWDFGTGVPVAPGTVNDSSVSVLYSTPGINNVSLLIANSTGTANVTKTAFIKVQSNTATYSSGSYSEGFETAALPNTDWDVVSPDGGIRKWKQSLNAHYTGAACAFLNNAFADTGDVDELVSPSIDMALMANPTMTFKVAYAQKTTGSKDVLGVYISSNCGKSWTLKKAIQASTLASVAATTNNFVPTTLAMWKEQSVTLSGLTAQHNVRFKFRFVNSGGNNIYIDDINISSPTGIFNTAENPYQFSISPNPTNSKSTFSFYLNDKSKTEISVVNVLGETVKIITKEELTTGQHSFEIEKSNVMKSGIYFVRLDVNGNYFTKKMIIE